MALPAKRLLLALSLLTFTAAGWAEPSGSKGGIVKWVDDKGVTHYGDAVPPEYANHAVTTLNKSGRVMRKMEAPRNDVTPVPDADEAVLVAEQKHHDDVLRASYTTEDEIDLARDRSMQMDESAIKGLEQRAAGAKERLAMHEKSAESYQARKKPVPADLLQDISNAKGELARINVQIAQKHQNIVATRSRFARDKQRFHELKGGSENTRPR